MEEPYKNAIDNFNEFIKQYDMQNNMISRKYYHTFKVADYAKEIAIRENLNKQDIFIAYLCGLLHDIARFKQATEYNTFIDLKSIDHGDLGYEILLENNYISNYIKDKESQIIVLKAVKNHNKYDIENGLNEREMLFAKIVRDADKIDIIDRYTDGIKEDNDKTIDSKILQSFIDKKLAVNPGIEQNSITQAFKQLCFVFDINFNSSLDILKETGIVKIIVNKLEDYVDVDLMKKIRENLKEVM